MHTFDKLSFPMDYGLRTYSFYLNSKADEQLFSSSITALKKTINVYELGSIDAGLVESAKRLDSAKVSSAADELMASVSKLTLSWAPQTALAGLVVLAPRMERHQLIRVADLLEETQIRLLNEGADDVALNSFLELWVRLPADERTDRLHGVIRRVLAACNQNVSYLDSSHKRSDLNMPDLFRCIAAVDFVPFLVDLLRDPGCVGELQSAVLARLEELAYPDPVPAAVFAGLAGDPRAALTLPALKQAGDTHRKQHRRFRTVSDAARWLADHHPDLDLDLDRPYHKISPAK